MHTLHPTGVACDGLVFAEGLRWHDGRLWLSDVLGERVYSFAPDGEKREEMVLPTRPSGLGFTPDGHLLVVSMRDCKLLCREADGLRTVAELGALAGGDLNDMVVGADGSAYIGNWGFDLFAHAEPRPAAIIRVDPQGEARIAAEDLDFPNGCAITPDGGTFYVAESFAHRLTAFTITRDGSLTARRVVAELPERVPDGICVDAESHVWVSCFGSHEFLRISPAGKITARVVLPESHRAVSCALGGPARRTLFLATAETTLDDLTRGKASSRIEYCEVDVPGAGWP